MLSNSHHRHAQIMSIRNHNDSHDTPVNTPQLTKLLEPTVASAEMMGSQPPPPYYPLKVPP